MKKSGWTEKSHLLSAERRIFHSLTGQDDEIQTGAGATGAGVPYQSMGPELHEGQRTLGTFNGVFAPVSLSMLSSILFLRIGYIVGNAGLLETALQLGIAYGILISTILSICAIATNGAVEVNRNMGVSSPWTKYI